MTTIVVSLAHKQIAADRRNTDSSGITWDCSKIEYLGEGRYFLGAGHLRTINMAKGWAISRWDPDEEPKWEFLLEDEEDRGMQCLVVDEINRTVTMINGELTPLVVQGAWFAIGSGAPFALGALAAGADPVEAVQIASRYDPATGTGVDSQSLSW